MQTKRYQSYIRHSFETFAFLHVVLIALVCFCFFIFAFYKNTVLQSRRSAARVLSAAEHAEKSCAAVLERLGEERAFRAALGLPETERRSRPGAKEAETSATELASSPPSLSSPAARPASEAAPPREPASAGKDAERVVYACLYRALEGAPAGSALSILDGEGKLRETTLYGKEAEAFGDSELASRLRREIQTARAEGERRPSSPAEREKPGADRSRLRVLFFRLCDLRFGEYWQASLLPLSPDCLILLLTRPTFWSELPLSERSGQVILCDAFQNILYSNFDPRSEIGSDDLDKYPHNKWEARPLFGNFVRIRDEVYYASRARRGDYDVIALSSMAVTLDFLRVGGLLSFFLLPLLWIFSLRFAKRRAAVLQEPFRQLLEAAELWKKGEKEGASSGAEFEEFQEIAATYTRLLNELEASTRKNLRLAARERDLEIRQLKSQFNPHFLFNVMDAIRYQISFDPKAASEMLVRLAGLLRYSIHCGQSCVDLRTDLARLEDYLLLQQLRYGRRLRYSLEFPEEVLSLRIPKLLLQPLIENSLLHGMNHGGDLFLVLRGERSGERLLLTAEDNGAGLAAEALAELRERLRQAAEEDRGAEEQGHLGLIYVQQMIRLLFGEEYGMDIASGEAKGFRVCLTLPAEEGAQKNESETDEKGAADVSGGFSRR